MENTSPKPLKILFVDNSRTTRTAMSMVLGREGYEVIPIATGQEAVEKLQVEHFDVVVTDLYMPFMNGHEVAKLIRALPDPCKDVPIIALTASDDPRDMEICKNAGMNEFIIKSDDNKGLLDVLKAYTQKLAK
jgi:CheY-like chemotaxis protein